jgi:hypothetical protein
MELVGRCGAGSSVSCFGKKYLMTSSISFLVICETKWKSLARAAYETHRVVAPLSGQGHGLMSNPQTCAPVHQLGWYCTNAGLMFMKSHCFKMKTVCEEHKHKHSFRIIRIFRLR